MTIDDVVDAMLDQAAGPQTLDAVEALVGVGRVDAVEAPGLNRFGGQVENVGDE